MPDIPEPDSNGWIERADGGLDLYWIQRQGAPDAVMELLAYRCKRKCAPNDCPVWKILSNVLTLHVSPTDMSKSEGGR